METKTIESKAGVEGENQKRGGSDRAPIQFVTTGMSKDGKWVFVDTVSRVCLHINYIRAMDRNKLACLAQESVAPSSESEVQSDIQPTVQKSKKPRKEDARTD
jgi:hypothetical protein